MRIKTNVYKTIALSLMVFLLQACGGGGGGGETLAAEDDAPAVCKATTPVTSQVVPFVPPVVPAGSIFISGTATFESIANNTTNGGLNYAAITKKPMRGITVRAVVGTNVYSTAITSDTGAYSLPVPPNSNVSVQLLAQLRKTTGTATWDVTVKDNTDGDAIWAIGSPTSPSGTADSVRNINAPLGWNAVSNTYSAATRLSGPYAILDTIYTGMQLVTTAQPNIQFPVVSVFWSPANNPASGSPTLGDIGGTFFRQATSSAGTVTRAIYVMGKENVDTDEFDSGVVAHEYGHYLQSAFSRNHSTGGPHSNGNKLDMTLSYGEGWGYAFASMARNNPQNPDSAGPAQASGFIIPTGTAPTSNKGWFSESSVQYIIYNLSTSQGFAPIWAAFSGPMRSGQDALNTMFSFAAGVRCAGNPAVTAALDNLLTSQSIFAGANANQWGRGETNDGGNANNLPVHKMLNSTAQPVCFNKDPNGTENKLGSNRYFRFTVPVTGVKTITVASNDADRHDIDFDVYQNGVLIGRAASESTTSEVASGTVAAGELLVRVTDFNIKNASTTSCATIRIN
jgi:Fungalysin metallopeptidase (M36)